MTSEMILQNPRWDDIRKIQEDIHLQKPATLPFHDQPSVISWRDLAQSGIMTLCGPRQIGKTTYNAVVISDFKKWRKARITLRNISRRILASLATPLNQKKFWQRHRFDQRRVFPGEWNL